MGGDSGQGRERLCLHCSSLSFGLGSEQLKPTMPGVKQGGNLQYSLTGYSELRGEVFSLVVKFK